ncbi:hypothetical protein, partial [Parapedobacter sp. 10938]|uniref:hypothetical protein n=1 Tax=Parapedobacter flavus TaxID=3110225 RepID=UPI002DBB9182
MTRISLRNLLFFLLALFGMQACSQQRKPDNQQEEPLTRNTPVNDQHTRTVKPDTAALFPTERGAFKNYAFVINGEVIDQEALSDYAGATLHTVFSYDTTLQGRKYSG